MFKFFWIIGTRRSRTLAGLEVQLFDYEFGVARVCFELEARRSGPDDTIQDLSFCTGALAVADPLGLDLVLLGQLGFEPGECSGLPDEQ